MLSMTISDFMIRLLVVVVIGFVIGFERQITGHNCSFKTTVLIAIGSFVFVAVEVLIGSDATRMAANVITGIGFLCSGVIFKNGLSVNGLNTSATLWCTAAISVLVGYGYTFEGLAATGVLVALNIIMAFGDKHVHTLSRFEEMGNTSYYIYIECFRTDVKKLKKAVIEELPKKATIDSFELDTMTGTKCKITIKLSTKGNPYKDISNLCDKLFEKEVISITFEKIEE